MPVPWEGWEKLSSRAREATGSSRAPARVLASLAEGLPGCDEWIAESPPARLLCAGELHDEPPETCTSIELAAYLLAASLHLSLPVAPCVQDVPDSLPPFWARQYGLCLVEDEFVGEVVAPFSSQSSPTAFRPLSPEEFLAHFLAAAGETKESAKEAYALFGAARSLSASPDILFRLGVVKVRFQAPQFGIEDMRRALGEGGGAEGYLQLGEALLARGMAGEALNAFTTAATKLPHRPEARFGRARAAMLAGRLEQAGTTLKELGDSAPGLPGLHLALAQYRLATGLRAEAIDSLRTHLASPAGTGDPEPVALLDMLLRAEGRPEEADGLRDSARAELTGEELEKLDSLLRQMDDLRDQAQKVVVPGKEGPQP